MNELAPIIYLVDDDPFVLKGLSRLMRAAHMSPLACSSAREFLDKYDPRTPGCLVLDFSMPGLDGLQLQQALAANGTEIPIIFLTGHGDIPTSVQAMKRGAVDFLTKPVNDETLLEAIRVAVEKDCNRRVERAELDDIRQRLATLTPREREVMEHVVAGQMNKEIGADLGTVEKTIKVHRGRVMEKMKVHSVAELVHLTERVGIPGRGSPPNPNPDPPSAGPYWPKVQYPWYFAFVNFPDYMSQVHPLIAIVDDDESVRKALQRLLRSAGTASESFPSGEAFLDSLPDHKPDCVILDLHMPRVTGFDVLAQLAKQGVSAPVIIITGHDSAEAYDRAMAGGATTYLRKPVNDDTLLDAVRLAVGEA
jgi:FixJ family two-component response regulator